MELVNGVFQNVNIEGVKFKVDLIPTGRLRRPGTLISPTTLTVHNTGCDKVPADNFRRVQLDPSQDKEVSWHFTIDDKEIIQHLPINEVAWHAGDRTGNFTSWSIEVCEVDGAEEVAIKFIAACLKYFNWDVSKVRTHKSWSGKQCPWKILPHWDKFIGEISFLVSKEEEVVQRIKVEINGVVKEVEAINKEGHNFIKLQDLKDSSINVSYDATRKMPIINVINR